MRRQAIILILMTAAAFLIADTINAFLAQSLTQPGSASPPSVETPRNQGSSVDPAQLAEEIVLSNLFPRSPASAAAVSGDPGGVPVPAVEAAKKVKLMGTVMGEGISALAVVQNLSSQRQLLYHLHEQIPDVGEISEIRATGIVIRQGERQELLELAGLVLAAPMQLPMPLPPVAGASRGIPVPPPPTKTSDGRPLRAVLDRRDVSAAVADPAKLQSQVRFEPAYTDGKLYGWRVAAYRSESLFEKVGLQSGDVLQQVNGTPVTDLNTLDRLFQHLKDERGLTLDVLRNGQKTTLTYGIR